MNLLTKLKDYWLNSANSSQARSKNGTFVQVSGRPPVFSQGSANATIASCAKILADAISMATFAAFDGKNKRLDLKTEHVINVRPNKYQTAADFWHTMATNFLIMGNSYAYISWKNGKLDQLLPLHPAHVTVLADNVGLLGKMKVVYEYREVRTGKTYTFLPGELLHLKWNSRDGIVGVPTAEALASVVQEDQESQDYIREVYRNGYSGVLSLEYTSNLSKEDQIALQNRVKTLLNAQGNRMLALPPGLTANLLGSGSIDTSYVDLRDRTTRKIAGFMGVPLILLDDISGSGSAAMSVTQTQSYYQHSIRPLLSKIEQELSCKLLTSDQLEDGCHYDEKDICGFLLLDAGSRTDNMVKLVAGGVLTTNEARFELGFEPYLDELESGDKLFRNGAFMTADMGDPLGDKSEKIKTDNASKQLEA